jgi:hypothetical protein
MQQQQQYGCKFAASCIPIRATRFKKFKKVSALLSLNQIYVIVQYFCILFRESVPVSKVFVKNEQKVSASFLFLHCENEFNFKFKGQ